MSSTAVLVGLVVCLAMLIWRAPRWVARSQQSGPWWAQQMVQAVAAHHGLKVAGRQGVGTVNGRPVLVRPVKVQGGTPAVDLSVALNLPPALGLLPRAESEGGLITGDKTFDRRWRVTGGPVMLALFSADVRKVFCRLGHDRVSIEGGRLLVRVLSDGHGATEIQTELLEALEAAELVETNQPDIRGLMEMGLNDLVPAVRAVSVRAALQLAVGDPRALPLLLPVVTQLEPALRVEAARALGPEGVALLMEVAASPTIRSGVRTAAFVAAVQRGASGAALVGIPELLLQMSSREARLELLAACAKSDTPVSIEVLRRLSADPVNEVRVAAAELLGMHPDQIAARPLLARLQHDVAPAVSRMADQAAVLPGQMASQWGSSFAQQVRALLDPPKGFSDSAADQGGSDARTSPGVADGRTVGV
jgi:hypothetical protein